MVKIFAWYETNDNMYPLGFNYFNNTIDEKDINQFKNFDKADEWNEFIDDSFVDSDGNKIQNSLEDKF